MFRDRATGTPEQLRSHVASLKLPDDIPQHEAVRAFALATLPTYGVSKWRYSLSCESAGNQGGNCLTGFIAVTASEV